MNKKYLGPVALMLAAVAGLAAMGLAFCWCCPDRLHDVGGVASRWCFKRQVVWNMLGACAALSAVAVGWKRLLKTSPLVSYDAAAVLASWFGAGVLLAIHAENTQPAVKN